MRRRSLFFFFPSAGCPCSPDLGKLCAASLSSPRSAGPTLIPFLYFNPLLFQLRLPFPLSHPFQFSPPPSARLPPSPRPRHCGFPTSGAPHPARGEVIRQRFPIACHPLSSPPFSPRSHLCALGSGTSGWRAEPKAVFSVLPLASSPAPQPRMTASQQ